LPTQAEPIFHSALDPLPALNSNSHRNSNSICHSTVHPLGRWDTHKPKIW
ncbi:hypothetical protein SARC_18146, partial [Sphaeroforma arctica JP610]